MMCRVGNDLCTAATAAVVIDRMELDEQDTISQLPSPGTRWQGLNRKGFVRLFVYFILWASAALCFRVVRPPVRADVRVCVETFSNHLTVSFAGQQKQAKLKTKKTDNPGSSGKWLVKRKW